MKVDPILAVKDVQESSKWYQTVFACTSIHGGNEFEVLTSKEGEIFLCLHKWGAHDHQTLKNPDITPGNGLILYFRIKNMEEVRENLREMNYALEEEIQVNPNSGKKEFSFIDPNGYYISVSEFHTFEA